MSASNAVVVDANDMRKRKADAKIETCILEEGPEIEKSVCRAIVVLSRSRGQDSGVDSRDELDQQAP